MQFVVLRKYLETLEYLSLTNAREYQNKFYIKKYIQKIYPKMSDDAIYGAIEKTNEKFDDAVISKKYISELYLQLLNAYSTMNETHNIADQSDV